MSKNTDRVNVAVVILSWQKPVETMRCAKSVLTELERLADVGRHQVVIVDNGSDKEVVEVLKDFVDENSSEPLRLHLNTKNMGFAAGMNKGIGALDDISPHFYWLLNDDIKVLPGALRALIDSSIEAPQVKIWGPTILDSITKNVECAGGCHYFRWLGMDKQVFGGKSPTQIELKKAPNFDYIYGAAMFLRADFVQAIGGLDDSYFLFYEELELARQLNSPDQKAWCRKSVVEHDGVGSELSKKPVCSVKSFHAALSAYRFTQKYSKRCLPTVVLSRIFGLTILAIRYQSPTLAAAPWRALYAFLKGD